MQYGVRPVKKDHRDYSAHRTLGAFTPPVFQDSYSCENGIRFPDQNLEGLPEGCTGYTQTDLCTDEDGIQYQPRYTYDQTLFIEGQQEGEGCDIRDSLKSTIMYGVLGNNETTDAQALSHRRAAYYTIELNQGLDWFDSIRNMLWAARPYKGSVSVASPWFEEVWTGSNVNYTGIVHTPVNWTWKLGHNWKISGWKTIDGVPYLMGKTWQGNVGDHGWCYFSREIVNKLMTVSGSGAFMLLPFDAHNPSDVQLVKLSLLDWLGSFIRHLLNGT